MEVEYSSAKVQKQCEDLGAASKLFGGNKALAVSLLARVNALKQAETLHDIIVQPQFHFHNLENRGRSKLKGLFAIDVKSRKDAWRLILRPLDEQHNPFDPCNIDEIAGAVEIVEITEVSKHYG